MAEKSISIDKAWEILFDRHDIAKQVAARGSFRISSADINTVKEARLMAKFDQSTQLPANFPGRVYHRRLRNPFQDYVRLGSAHAGAGAEPANH